MRLRIGFFLLFFLPSVIGAMELPTAEVVLAGRFHSGPVDVPTRVDATDFSMIFGSATPEDWPAEAQALQFFRNGGTHLEVVRIDPGRPLAEALPGALPPAAPRGLGWLELLPDAGLLVAPELTELPDSSRDEALEILRAIAEERHLTVLLDTPVAVDSVAAALDWNDNLPAGMEFAALYYPRVEVDPARWVGESSDKRVTIGASGSAAARIAAIDASQGVWQSPAGLTATLAVEGLAHPVTTAQVGDLNAAHVNGIQDFTSSGHGIVMFGARTLDRGNPENTLLASARTQRWIAHRLRRSLAFAAFEANDEALWANMRSHADSFLNNLYIQGAFAGIVPEDAWFVRCDASTTTSEDQLGNRANLVFGVAFTRPAEFFVTTLTLPTVDPARLPPSVPLRLMPPRDGVASLYHYAAAGFRHTLQVSDTLEDFEWTPHEAGTDPLTGYDGWTRWDVAIEPGTRFFRLRMDR